MKPYLPFSQIPHKLKTEKREILNICSVAKLLGLCYTGEGIHLTNAKALLFAFSYLLIIFLAYLNFDIYLTTYF